MGPPASCVCGCMRKWYYNHSLTIALSILDFTLRRGGQMLCRGHNMITDDIHHQHALWCGNGTTSVANRAAKNPHARGARQRDGVRQQHNLANIFCVFRHNIASNISNTHVSNSDRSLHLSHHRNAMRRPLAELGEIAYG